MTDKKETILHIALRLFAEQGYESTPTNQIAKEAKVSEGLIFKHFENKEGLLKALISEGESRAKEYIKAIQEEQMPHKRLTKAIDLPALLVGKEREYWKLIAVLKHKNQYFALLQKQGEIFQHLFQSLVEAFELLQYTQPQIETQLLMTILEGLFNAFLVQDDLSAFDQMLKLLKSKYGLS